MWFTGIQATLSALLVLATSYIAAGIGADGWYYLGAGMSGVVLIVSIWACPETKYDRPLSAYQGQAAQISHFVNTTGEEEESGTTYQVLQRVTTTQPREFDLTRYKPRTLSSDARIFVSPPDWTELWRCVKGMVQVMFFPNIFWAFLLNGLTV